MRRYCLPLRNRSWFRPGFTLAEVLVAIIILLIGVAAAMRIFPRGFDIFRSSVKTYAGLSLVDQWASEFEEHPENLPEVYPVDEENTNMIAGFDVKDLTAANYISGDWYWNHLFLRDGKPALWPMGEPISVRVLRRMVGEQCTIPSAFTEAQPLCTVQSVVSEGNNSWALEVSSTAQLQPNMQVRVIGTNQLSVMASVYSVDSPTQVKLVTNGTALTGATEIYANGAIAPKYLVRFGPIELPHTNGAQTYNQVDIYDLRYRRVNMDELRALHENQNTLDDTLYYAMDYVNGKAYFLPDTQKRRIRVTYFSTTSAGELKQLTPSKNNAIIIDAAPSLDSLVEKPLNVPSGAKIVVGSEVLNRAYQQVTDQNMQFALPSGFFYVEETPSAVPDSRPFSVGYIFFSAADAGRKVKIDYTVADWNILHEDVALDGQSQFQLSLLPKIRLRNDSAIRGTSTWGLYGPMRAGQEAVVLILVDLNTGYPTEIKVDNPAAPTNYSSVVAQGLSLTKSNQNSAVFTVKDAVGRGVPSGHRYRVYYRAVGDWTLHFFRPPSQFWYVSTSVTSEIALRSEDLNLGLQWRGFTWIIDAATHKAWVAVPAVYEGQSVAVDYLYTPAGKTRTQMSGEVHVIPMREHGKSICVFRLNHEPDDGSLVTVRGVSATIRALWIQPRSGKMATITEDKLTGFRSIPERWLSKQATVALPVETE